MTATAMMPAEDLLGGSTDPLRIIADDPYQETGSGDLRHVIADLDALARTQSLVPMPIPASDAPRTC